MSKTAAERQKEYRDRQRNTQNAMATAAGVIIPVLDDGIERNAPTERNYMNRSQQDEAEERNADSICPGITAISPLFISGKPRFC